VAFKGNQRTRDRLLVIRRKHGATPPEAMFHRQRGKRRRGQSRRRAGERAGVTTETNINRSSGTDKELAVKTGKKS